MASEEKKEYMEQIFQRLREMSYIRPSDIPGIDLYMDQVTTFMDEHLEHMKRHDSDKMLTKTMINNYTKNDLLPSPNKKKYSKEHMLLLIFIYYFKNVLPIGDIQEIIDPLKERYFGGKDEISLEDIYLEVFSMEEEQIQTHAKDLLKKYDLAMSTFEQEEDPEKRRFLTDFSFLCTLCFDVYVKKTVIEHLIDSRILKGEETEKDEKKAKKEKKEKKDKKESESDE